MKLKNLQQRFEASILDTTDPAVLSYIIGNQQLDNKARLAVYQNNYELTMVGCLAKTYKVVEKLVAEDFFHAMAAIYVAEAPSHSFTLNNYGSDFAEFIAAFEPASELPYLPDVARLEWAAEQVLISADQVAFDFDALAAVPETLRDNIILELPAGSFLLESSYPVRRIWEVNQENYKGDPSVNLEDGRQRLIVWRQGLKLRIDSLNETEWPILTAIGNAIPFAQLCENLAEFDIVNALPQLIMQGWIKGFH